MGVCCIVFLNNSNPLSVFLKMLVLPLTSVPTTLTGNPVFFFSPGAHFAGIFRNSDPGMSHSRPFAVHSVWALHALSVLVQLPEG